MASRVKGAIVEAYTRFRTAHVGAGDEAREKLTLLGQGRSDGEGRYRLDAPRTKSDRVFQVSAVAAAPGYGLGWAVLNPDAEEPAAEIRLLPEQTYRIRLVDVNGSPAKGVEVQVGSIGRRTAEGRFDGVATSGNPPDGMLTWPRPVTTDDQGRIALTGLGRGPGIAINLSIVDPRHALQSLQIDAARPGDQEVTLALQPATTIEGRVLAADTGLPVPNAVVSVGAGRGQSRGFRVSRVHADDRGRFTASSSPGEYFQLHAYAPEGQPYLIPQVEFNWTKGAVKKTVDIGAPPWRPDPRQGHRGRHEPPAGRLDRLLHRHRAPQQRDRHGLADQRGQQAGRLVRDRGRARQGAPARLRAERRLRRRRGRLPHARRRPARRLAVPGPRRHPLRGQGRRPAARDLGGAAPGATIRGRVEGPDGQTVTAASIITTLHAEPTRPAWMGNNQVKVSDGRFELHGLDPEKPARISVYDPEHEWGTTLEVSGKQSGEDLTIRLQPCGRAKMRFVGPDGRPIVKPPAIVEFVATPGPSLYSRRKPADQNALPADADFLANVDRKHHRDDPVADAEGRFTLVALIPGAIYRISDFSTVNEEGAPESARSSPSRPMRRWTWATSGSRSRRADRSRSLVESSAIALDFPTQRGTPWKPGRHYRDG